MYLLFVRHHWKPSEYYRMKPGERIIVRAFLEQQYADEKKEADRIRHAEQ